MAQTLSGVSVVERNFGEEHAYRVVHRFFGIDEPTDELYDEFHHWLMDGDNAAAKQSAMERVMRERLWREE